MKKNHDLYLRKDLIKLGCLIAAALGTLGVFIVTPALSSPTLLSLVATLLISPWVSALERRGYSKTLAISVIFGILALAIFCISYLGVRVGIMEWNTFKEQAPYHFHTAIEKLEKLEREWKSQYIFLGGIHLTETLLHWGEETGNWFVDHGASLMGSVLTWILIIPPLTFVLLNEGRDIRRRFFRLVPNRYFESFFMITTDIVNSISDYIRAKLIEAILVGTMVMVGLALVRAPYAVVLGVVAGVTNIVPYLGPILGAIPACLLVLFDQNQNTLVIPVLLVYVIANLIDTVVIFPLVVAKLVNLHPLILIAVVAVGQHYYGLVGMLISIPIATALKVVLLEIYMSVYESRSQPGVQTAMPQSEKDPHSLF
jgi:putative permease